MVENAQCVGVFGGYDNSACVAVNAVNERRSEGKFAFRLIFSFFKKITLDSCYERVDILAVVRVREQTGLFVEKKNVFVLIDDIKLF